MKSFLRFGKKILNLAFLVTIISASCKNLPKLKGSPPDIKLSVSNISEKDTLKKFAGYSGKLSIYDSDGDLESYVICVDNEPTFTKMVKYLIDKEVKNYGFSGGSVGEFGQLPKGKHSLKVVAHDLAGNVARESIDYNLK